MTLTAGCLMTSLPKTALVAGVLYLVTFISAIPAVFLSAIGTLPIFLWELSLGLWMTFKGFNASVPVLRPSPSRFRRSFRSARMSGP